MPGPQPYKHKNLDEGHIRILHLHPGERHYPIFVSISREKLSSIRNTYEALSWEWGTEIGSQHIRILDEGSHETCTLPVRQNLLDALRQFRTTDSVIRLWADAVCIDQKNGEEKKDQIGMMTEIYRSATQARVWLGNAHSDSAEALKYVDELVKLDHVEHIAGLARNDLDESTAKKVNSLINLLKRGWFSRRWVVQV